MTLDVMLEFVSPLMQTGVLVLLFGRRIYRTLPLFSSYLIWLLPCAGIEHLSLQIPGIEL